MDVWADVYFTEDNGTSAKVSYLLQYDLEEDGSNFAGLMTLMDALIVGLNALTMDAINRADLRFVAHTAADVPNDASNNQIHALVRSKDSGGNDFSWQVPAWDTALYEKDKYGLLGGVFNTAAGVVNLLIRNTETNLALVSVPLPNGISKTSKGRGKKVT